MNRLFALFSIAAASSAAFSGCSGCSGCTGDPDVIWDFVNPSVCFFVTDAATGENLLDPESEHTIAEHPITVSYRGEVYPVVRTDAPQVRSSLPTRANPARPLALRLENRDALGVVEGWHLSFGEFDPAAGWYGERFTIDWGDGRSNEVEFGLWLTWKSSEPTSHSPLSLDGVPRGEGYYDAWVIPLER